MNLSWDQVTRLSQVLSSKLLAVIGRDKLPLVHILTIPRGGLPIAALVSHILDIPGDQIQWDSIPIYGEIVVILDEIADTGRTLVDLRSQCSDEQRTITAALITKSTCNPKPDISGLIITSDEWVVFPWEIGTNENKRDRDDVDRAPETMGGVQLEDPPETNEGS